jgi:hypothetical protein
MSLSVHWWESSSLPTSISAAAAVLAVFVAIWAAVYASRPRRGLAYSAKMRLPTADERKIWINNVVPKDEQERVVIITLVLHGSGRLDVPTSLFDNATPIILSVKDAEIRSAGPVLTRGGGGLTPSMQVRENRLEIGPGLIGRKQVFSYTLIAVTKKQLRLPSPARVTSTSALVDTRLRADASESLIRLRAIGILAAAFFVLWGIWLRHTSFHWPIPPRILLLWGAVVAFALWPSPNRATSRQARQVKALVHKRLAELKREDQPPPEDQSTPESQQQKTGQ